MSLELKVAVVQSGQKSYSIASQLSWHPSKLSCIINGIRKATPEEKAQIASVLDVKVGDIFPEREGE